jgi:signal transduction histidine kinase
LVATAARSAQSFAPWSRAALLAVLIVAWFALNLATNATRLLDFSPNLYVGVEAAASFARLFGALVLFLASDDRDQPRLRWIAASFLALGLGGLVFGYLPPILHRDLSTNSALFASRFVWTVAGGLILCGVVRRDPPAFRPRSLAWGTTAVVAVLAVVTALPIRLPTLVRGDDLSREVVRNRLVLDGMTGWHWVVSAIPFALVLVAAVALVRRGASDVLGGRLLVAMVLFAGAQLHDVLWPSAYGPVLTSSDVLELLFASVVAVAGVVELRRVGDERAVLLAREREHSRALRELAVLKNDFTAMVAHELGNPLSAIRRQADLIARGRLEGETRDQALAAIQAEAKFMTQLVLDVQEGARVERADFAVAPRPYPVEALLDDAAAYARTLPGTHPVEITGTVGRVLADPERIGQVLRNLLSNAARYSPDAAPIGLRAARRDGRVRIEVEDRGVGIAAADATRIFGKFERGDRQAGAPRGAGLGLYVARQIVVAHGSDLTVSSQPGRGSVFAFALETVL